MKDIKNVLICGLGAIGSIYANLISKYDFESLKILVDKNRYEKYQKEPLKFNGKELYFNYILPSNNDFKADLIIIATKNNDLRDVINNIKNFVQENSIIISLLNGITSEKEIANTYGENKLVYSYFIGHSAVRVNRCVTQDGVNKIVFGNYQNKNNVIALKNYFDKVGINYEIPDDIIHSMWLKFMLNVSTNQPSAIWKYTFGEMQNSEKCLNFIINVMKEVQSIAKAEGVQNTESMVDEALISFKKMTPEGKTSMLQDVEAGRKTEVDIFSGEIIKLAKKHNIFTPYNKVLYELIKATE